MNVVRMLSRGVCVLAVLLVWAVPVRAATGRLYVKSKPRGARIYLDGETEPRAKTPCFLRNLEVGIHLLRATLDGYADVVEEVEVTEGKMARAALEFTAETTGGDAEGGDDADPPATDRSPDKSSGSADGDPAETKGPSSASRPDKPPKYIDVDCHICDGTGLLQQTTCPACAGTGWKAGRQCGECGGKGRVEHKCAACKGEGTVVVRGKEGTCGRCRGKGKMPCLPCRGTGKLKRRNPARSRRSTTPCPRCAGTGFEQHARCLTCSGRGTLTSGEGTIAGGGGVTGRGRGRGRGRGGIRRTVVNFDCPFCGGDGAGPPMCRACRGLGLVGPDKAKVTCSKCFGTGRVYRPCRACAGRGWIIAR